MIHNQDYLDALEHVITIEGRPTNYKWDPGGATAYGISKVHWPQYWRNGPPTPAVARVFYHKEFWLPLRLDDLALVPLRQEIFEAAVNVSKRNGVKFAQRAYNLLRPRRWKALKADGKIGRKTIAALNQYTRRYQASILAGCNFYQAQYYATRRDSLQEKAIRGWFEKRLGWSLDK